METSRQSRQQGLYTRLAIIVLLAITTAIIYGRTAGFEFVNFDDPDYVTQNIAVQSGFTSESIRWAFTTFHAANWFPVTWLSHMADAAIFGPWPGGHHLTSVLLHTANSILLFLLLYRITNECWKSSFVAALFALHPLHVESVAWVSERKDLLSTFFFLSASFAYVRYTEFRSLSRYLLLTFLFALGLMSKPMLVTLPLILLLLDYWPLKRFKSVEAGGGLMKDLPPLIFEKIPLLILSLISAIVTILAQNQGETIVSTEVLPLFQRIGRVFVHYCWYSGKLLWPMNLAFYYPVITGFTFLKWSAAVLTVTGVSIIAIRRRCTEPFLFMGWFWFIISLFPVIGLVAVGMQGTADRYAYIPSIGFFIALTWTAGALAGRLNPNARRSTLAGGAFILLASLSVLTWHQLGIWRTSRTLAEHAVNVTKDNYVALTILGDSLDDAGQSYEGIEKYKQALQIKPEYDIARNSLGVALCKQGRTDEAMREFALAVNLRPSYADAYVNMGVCMSGTGRIDEAVKYYRKALSIRPDHYTASQYLRQALGTL